MAEFYFDNLAKNLPDVYKKDRNSNNFKILEMERLENVGLRENLFSIESIIDIDNATGATLDIYGAEIGQLRGNASDQQYRIMIKSKVLRGLCNGSYKSIVDALCFTFGCTIDDVQLIENDDLSITVYKLPLDGVLGAGFSPTEAEQIIRTLMPVGVKLDSVMFEGTFEFGASEYELDENAGFSEAENGEYGGYLGYAASAEKQGTLPI